jgi:hypothetical protein
VTDSATSPDDLLFRDRDGNSAPLQEVIDDGLDGGYEDRIPALEELLRNGTPEQRLYAAVALASWGQRPGFDALISWASEPGSAPWAGAPITYSRISGADAGFELLADALRASYLSKAADRGGIRPLQVAASKALLGLADSHDFDRTLLVALVKDPEVTALVADDLKAALDAALTKLEAGENPGFDLATQTAGLLAPLARVDDAAAAHIAERLVKLRPSDQRMVRELVDSLAEGRGSATLHVLESLRSLEIPGLDAEVDRAIARHRS